MYYTAPPLSLGVLTFVPPQVDSCQHYEYCLQRLAKSWFSDPHPSPPPQQSALTACSVTRGTVQVIKVMLVAPPYQIYLNC